MLIKNNSALPPLPPRPPRNWFYGHTQNWPTVGENRNYHRRGHSNFFNGPGFGEFPLPPQLRRMFLGFAADFWESLSPARQAQWTAVGAAHLWPRYAQAPANLSGFAMWMFFNLTLFYANQRSVLLAGTLPFQALSTADPNPIAPAAALTLNSGTVNSDGSYTLNVTGPSIPFNFYLINVYYSNPANKTASNANLFQVDTAFMVGKGPTNITSLGIHGSLISAIAPRRSMRVGVRATSYQILGDPTGTNRVCGPITSKTLREL